MREEESLEIDRQMEELMLPDSGNGKKKKDKKNQGRKRDSFHPIQSFRRAGKIKKAAILMAGAAAVFIFSRLGADHAPTGLPASVMPLVQQDIQEKLIVNGPVSGTDSVDVVSNIHAEITAMNVKEGDQVKKGQVLAVVDSTDLEREVEIAQNAYDLAVANKAEKDREAALGYEKAVQDFHKASLDHSRNSQLFAAGDISQLELETSANAMNDARRQVESYTVENGRGVADASYALQIENAAFELEKKKEELDNTQIRSTIDGTVVRVNSKVGQFADKVEDDKPILSIENLQQLEMEIKVSEFSIGKVAVGQQALITADILGGQAAEGRVVKISPTGEEKGGGSTERVIPTIIQVTDPTGKLIAGITAKAELLIRESKEAFTVPTTALFEDGDQIYIAVVQEEKVHRIPVEMGVDGDVIVEVIPTDGTVLEEGMEVITNPTPEFTEGAAVAVFR